MGGAEVMQLSSNVPHPITPGQQRTQDSLFTIQACDPKPILEGKYGRFAETYRL